MIIIIIIIITFETGQSTLRLRFSRSEPSIYMLKLLGSKVIGISGPPC